MATLKDLDSAWGALSELYLLEQERCDTTYRYNVAANTLRKVLLQILFLSQKKSWMELVRSSPDGMATALSHEAAEQLGRALRLINESKKVLTR